MRLLFIGFGTVGQGLAELLLKNKDELFSRYGIGYSVVGISDNLKGSIIDSRGIDLAAALKEAFYGNSKRSNDYPRPILHPFLAPTLSRRRNPRDSHRSGGKLPGHHI